MYVKMGYNVYPKKAKTKSGKGLTKDKMKAHIQEIGDEEGLKELEKKIKAKENFMRITSWYKEKYEK